MASRGIGCDYRKDELYKKGSGIVGKQGEAGQSVLRNGDKSLSGAVRKVADTGGKLVGPHLKTKYEY
jgi:hypothetical protein